jgi:phosphohistidine phosphatase
MELFLLRHAEAGKRLPARAKDADRPLTEEGKEELKLVARAIKNLNVKPDLIVSSPLKRAKETAEITARTIGGKPRTELWDELKPEGSREAFLKRLSSVKAESIVLCVGHEPYLTELIGDVTHNRGRPMMVLKKAGIARLSLKSLHPKAEGELKWLLTPRLLKRLS